MRLEVAVIGQFFHRFGITHEGARHPLNPQAVGVPDAVGAVQRTALDVVETEAAFAVLHDFTDTFGQAVDLIPAQQGNTSGHLVLSMCGSQKTQLYVRFGE